jgi:hypothetical protein
MGTAHPTKTSEREAKGGKRAAVKQTTGGPPLRSDAAKGAAEDTRSPGKDKGRRSTAVCESTLEHAALRWVLGDLFQARVGQF